MATNINAIIPARGGSKVIRNKNLQMINGMPMLAYTIIATKVVSEIDNVYVSSDNDHILNVVALYGATPIKRPTAIAQDTSTTESVVSHFLSLYSSQTRTVVLVQPTSPMVIAEDIKRGIQTYQKNKHSSLFSACKTNDLLIWDEDGMYPINYDPRNRGYRQTRKRCLLHENGAFYIFKKQLFIQTHCRLGGKNIGWSEMPAWRSFQVDSKEDLERVRTLMTLKMGKDGI